jgi:DNA-binding transcriptional ArsR family regulator
MPFNADEGGDRPPQVDVRPSAVLELTWVVSRLHWRIEPVEIEGLRVAATELREELQAVWGDGRGCLPDTSILAERIGALLTDEADTFLDGMERAVHLGGAGLELDSESPDDRDATLVRLERLRQDPALTRRYAGLLRRIWELVRPTWEETGREEVLQACADWSRRLHQGATMADLFPNKHLIHRTDQTQLLTRRPRFVLSPMHFVSFGGFVVDMTSYVHLGGPARPADEGRRRKESELIAARLKVLSDATRVSILRELTDQPASVMDLARRFQLSQPTVSSHVRLLRDAGLLESRRDGARILYSAPRPRLDKVLEDTRHLLLEH